MGSHSTSPRFTVPSQPPCPFCPCLFLLLLCPPLFSCRAQNISVCSTSSSSSSSQLSSSSLSPSLKFLMVPRKRSLLRGRGREASKRSSIHLHTRWRRAFLPVFVVQSSASNSLQAISSLSLSSDQRSEAPPLLLPLDKTDLRAITCRMSMLTHEPSLYLSHVCLTHGPSL